MKETQNSQRAKALQPNPTASAHRVLHTRSGSGNCSKIPPKIQLWASIIRLIASIPWQKWHWDVKLLLIIHQPLIYLLTFHLWCFLYLISNSATENFVYISCLKQNASLRRLQFKEPCNRSGGMFIAVLSKDLHLKTIKRFQMTVWCFAVVFCHLFCVWQNKKKLVKSAKKPTFYWAKPFLLYHWKK